MMAISNSVNLVLPASFRKGIHGWKFQLHIKTLGIIHLVRLQNFPKN